MSTRSEFLMQTDAASAAAAASGELVKAGEEVANSKSTADSGEKGVQTIEDFLEKSVVPRDVIERFIRGPESNQFARFDPEVGYLPSNSLMPDGIDGSSTVSTFQSNGARAAFNYADRKPRINTYGDSYTQCHGVSDGETWQEYLAAHLGEPIGNFGVGGFGVYQAYRRMIREERTDHGAQYLIFHIYGDDSIRSLYRSRWVQTREWFSASKYEGSMFHGNCWSNVEIDMATGQLVEREQLLPTKESLYRMTEAKWLVEHLKDDLALQLALYCDGRIRELNRAQITKLAALLDVPFDWDLDSKAAEVLPNLYRSTKEKGSAMTRMQAQATKLLDRYSLRATRFILDKARAFANQNGKQLLVVLIDPYRAMNELRQHGTRYDQEIVDYLVREKVNYIDMNEVHLGDFKRYNLSWDDYINQYFLGHYSPNGNHFFAHSIKDKVVQWLDPKPLTYQPLDQKHISFKGYIKGYE
ncbi:hypothetical protein QA640_39530 [Bradyrhizobium sp. CB82]|uniref:hypothetical protein n=1 Tax=Bradyrhizobium sp. CB82 TaxID=3039159 RepID=UPI0024B22D3F|nr:hypothetical protein [Bradyrhizobium sp. CB82]WFU40228.1 hypothetical protein QA640_39530 [Bradyrhizobium sp. CB82]